MEYENPSEIAEQKFDFLNDYIVKKNFADLNMSLLSGRHIQQYDGPLFQLLDDYSKHFRYYYEDLYALNLDKNTKDGCLYYFLDFPDNDRAKISSPERCRPLTQRETIIGIMLLNMYYDRYFDDIKEIHWSNIEAEILEGKNSDLYKKLFFGDIRDHYTPQEWGHKKNNFKNTISTFEKLGWLQKSSSTSFNNKDDFRFTLQPSIHRLASLYEQELDKFDAFVENYYQSKNV